MELDGGLIGYVRLSGTRILANAFLETTMVTGARVSGHPGCCLLTPWITFSYIGLQPMYFDAMS